MSEKKEVPPTGEKTEGLQVVNTPRASSAQDADTPDSMQASSAEPATGERIETTPQGGDMDATTRQKSKRPRVALSSISALIEHGYSRKGQRITVKPSDLKIISANTALTDEDIARLHDLGAQDKVFAVPRQLLLVARELRETPKVRSELRGFVASLLQAHPLITVNHLELVIQNQEGSPSLSEAFRAITTTDGSSLCAQFPAGVVLKPGELAALKRNTIGCLAVWAMDTRAISNAELISALFDGYWEPAAGQSSSELDLLRVLTEAEEPVFAGLICQEFKRRTDEHARLAERSAQAAAAAKSDMHRMSTELEAARAELAGVEAEVQGIRHSLQAERDKARVDATHFRDDFETLRTRVLRRLSDDLKLLGDGLVALGRAPPKVDVMVDHAERVADSLRSEIKKLEGG